MATKNDLANDTKLSFSKWVLERIRGVFRGIRMPKTPGGKRAATSITIFILFGGAAGGLISIPNPLTIIGGVACAGIALLAWAHTLVSLEEA